MPSACTWLITTPIQSRSSGSSRRTRSSTASLALHYELLGQDTRDARQSPIYSSGGVYTGNLFAVPLEDARLQQIFTWLTRGAYSYFRGARIPDNYTFNFARVDRVHASEIW